jgi:hypothetical protein
MAALLRAVLGGGCSGSGQALMPALSFAAGGTAALWSQERGFKKSTKRVEICLLKVSDCPHIFSFSIPLLR